MTIRSMVSGKLIRAPQTKSAEYGGSYTFGVIKADWPGDIALFVWVLAFGEAADRLAGLGSGDTISAVGALKLGIYRSEGGNRRLHCTLLADELLSIRRAPRERARHGPEGDLGPPSGDQRWLDA